MEYGYQRGCIAGVMRAGYVGDVADSMRMVFGADMSGAMRGHAPMGRGGYIPRCAPGVSGDSVRASWLGRPPAKVAP